MSGRRGGGGLVLTLWVALTCAVIGLWPRGRHGSDLSPHRFVIAVVVCGVAAVVITVLVSAVLPQTDSRPDRPYARPDRRPSQRAARARRRERRRHRPPRMCRWLHRSLGWWRPIEIDGHLDIYCRCGRGYRRTWQWNNPPSGATGVRR